MASLGYDLCAASIDHLQRYLRALSSGPSSPIKSTNSEYLSILVHEYSSR